MSEEKRNIEEAMGNGESSGLKKVEKRREEFYKKLGKSRKRIRTLDFIAKQLMIWVLLGFIFSLLRVFPIFKSMNFELRIPELLLFIFLSILFWIDVVRKELCYKLDMMKFKIIEEIKYDNIIEDEIETSDETSLLGNFYETVVGKHFLRIVIGGIVLIGIVILVLLILK